HGDKSRGQTVLQTGLTTIRVVLDGQRSPVRILWYRQIDSDVSVTEQLNPGIYETTAIAIGCSTKVGTVGTVHRLEQCVSTESIRVCGHHCTGSEPPAVLRLVTSNTGTAVDAQGRRKEGIVRGSGRTAWLITGDLAGQVGHLQELRNSVRSLSFGRK